MAIEHRSEIKDEAFAGIVKPRSFNILGRILNVGSDDKSVVAVPEFKFIQIDDSSEEDPLAAFVSATYEVNYSVDSPESFSHSQLLGFAAVSGVYNCWPYLREFISNSCVRMEAPHHPIPLCTIHMAAAMSGHSLADDE
jgi:hypothetical protein